MHEFAIANSILKKANERATLVDCSAIVKKIYLKAGEFTNVDPESLHFAFNSIKSFFPACNNSCLNIETVPTQAICHSGEHIYHPCLQNSYVCSQCGGGIGRIISGEELCIVDIEVMEGEKEYAQ